MGKGRKEHEEGEEEEEEEGKEREGKRWVASWEVQCTHRVGVLSNEFDFVICMYDSLLFVISHAVNLVQPFVHSTISVRFPVPEVGGVYTQLSFETQTSVSVLYILFVYFSIFCTYVHMYVFVLSGCEGKLCTECLASTGAPWHSLQHKWASLPALHVCHIPAAYVQYVFQI